MDSCRDLPQNWIRSTLGRLASYANGFAFKPADWSEHGVPIIRIAQMTDPSATPDRYQGHLPDRFRVDTGDLLFSWSATLMAMIWNRGPGFVNQHVFKVEPSAGTDKSFLHHLLSFSIDALGGQSHGTTMRHIKRSDLLPFEVAVPVAEVEQCLIAQILDTVDEAIDQTEQLIAKLKQVKQGLFYDLFTRGIDDNGELRDPERHPEQFKESLLGRIPREWKLCELEAATAAPICYGIVQPGPYVAGGPCVLTIGDLAGDFRTGLNRTSPLIDRQYSRSRVQSGDVILSIKGTIGRAAVVPGWYEGNISRDLARLRPNNDILAQFLRYYLEGPAGQRRLELAVVGTTRAELSIQVLKHFSIPAPRVLEQAEAVQRIEAVVESIDGERQSLAKLRLLKAGLMEDLLTGRARVTPLLEQTSA